MPKKNDKERDAKSGLTPDDEAIGQSAARKENEEVDSKEVPGRAKPAASRAAEGTDGADREDDDEEDDADDEDDGEETAPDEKDRHIIMDVDADDEDDDENGKAEKMAA